MKLDGDFYTYQLQIVIINRPKSPFNYSHHLMERQRYMNDVYFHHRILSKDTRQAQRIYYRLVDQWQ